MFHIIRSNPRANNVLRVGIWILLLTGIAWALDLVNTLPVALMSLPAVLLSGADQPGTRRLRVLLQAVFTWSLGAIGTWWMVRYGWPLGLTFALVGLFFGLYARNGPAVARLGMSGQVFSGLSFALSSNNVPDTVLALLLVSPLLFVLYSWLWYRLFRHITLQDSLRALFRLEARYMQTRARIITAGENMDRSLERIDRAIAAQLLLGREALSIKGWKGKTLSRLFFLCSDIFEQLQIAHHRQSALSQEINKSPDVLNAYRHWNIKAVKVLRAMARVDLNRRRPDSDSLGKLAHAFLERVNENSQDSIRYWKDSIRRLSALLDTGQPLYERTPRTRPEPAFNLFPLKIPAPIWHGALRKALVLGTCGLIIDLTTLDRAYWMILAATVAMQGSYLQTRTRVWQANLGTLAGVMLAAALIKLGASVPVMAGTAVALGATAVYNLRVRYLIGAAGIGAMLILMFEVFTRQGLQYVMPRIIDTLIGGVIAFLGYAFVFPRWQKDHIDDSARQAILSAGTLLEALTNGEITEQALGLLRQEMLARWSAWNTAYTEMLQEPGGKAVQQRADLHHQLLRDHHQLIRNISTLKALHHSGLRYNLDCNDNRAVVQAVDALASCFGPQPQPWISQSLVAADCLPLGEDEQTAQTLIISCLSLMSEMYAIAFVQRSPDNAGHDE